jgi:hypothetical protein
MSAGYWIARAVIDGHVVTISVFAVGPAEAAEAAEDRDYIPITPFQRYEPEPDHG